MKILKMYGLLRLLTYGVRFIMAIFCSIAVTKAAQRRLSMQLIKVLWETFAASRQICLYVLGRSKVFTAHLKAQIFLQYYTINVFWAATGMNWFYRKTAEVLQKVDNDR